MRVPGISPTAGYAAQSQYEPYLSEQFYTGLQTTTEINKNNGNIIPSTQQLSLANTSNFVSSADEFVQRALSSMPTSYESESNLKFLRTCNENVSNDMKQSLGDHIYTQQEANQYNTYRSFKDAFNINKTFYEECAKNLHTLNSQELEEDIDPILVINTPYSDDICSNETSTIRNVKICVNEDQTSNGILKYNTHDIEDTLQYQNNQESTDTFDDNDYNDQTMLDLCQDRYNGPVNEVIDREIYLTSPTSSSISDQTPKRTFSYFPRGIINPNYPGFQHLAHTLSEHFITGASHSSDSYDSDISEYEMELSADSFEDLSNEADEKFNSKLNKFNNNLEEPHSTKISKMHPDDMYVEQDNTYDCYVEYRDNSDNNCNVDIGNLPISLKTTLTLLEPADRIPTPSETPEPNEEIENFVENKITYATTPPDILMEDDHLQQIEKIYIKENRPDLLHGVSPHHVSNKSENLCENRNSTSIVSDHTNAVIELPAKDEMSLGVTPVDIIGDFGQEVEREFGLLVSGYRRLMDGAIERYVDEGKDDNRTIVKHPEHLIDAVLSKVNDEIDAGKYLTALKECNSDEPKCLESNLDFERSAIRRNTDCDFVEDNNAVDWTLSTNAEEENIVDAKHIETLKADQILNETSTNFTNGETSTNMEDEIKGLQDNLQKPKYQKASYDERQLPPVPIEYKRCQQIQRKGRGTQQLEKNPKPIKKPSFANRFLHGKRSVFKSNDQGNSTNRKREEAEIHQYQQLINDKELILSNSRYTKLSSWAQYLKNSVKERRSSSTDLISPSALELFDAYKVGGEVDKETLQKHLKLAKEIEKKVLMTYDLI